MADDQNKQAQNEKRKDSDEAESRAARFTKIRIIEDAEATGDTAAAYDFWRTGSGSSVDVADSAFC